MDIVCSIDNNYVQHCCCMLVSFFENNKGEKHSIHLLSDALTLENRKMIKELVEFYQGVFYRSFDDSDLLQVADGYFVASRVKEGVVFGL